MVARHGFDEFAFYRLALEPFYNTVRDFVLLGGRDLVGWF
jgi:hypothetical protein